MNNASVTKSDIDKVAELLINHIGRKSAIKSTAICNAVGFEAKATNIHCRTVITEVSRYYELPIIACHKGYFIAETQEEIDEYMDRLNAEIKGIEERRAMVLANFK